MRIIKKKTLQDFWVCYPDAEQPLKYWFEKIKNAEYQNPNEVIMDNPKSDTIGNGRIIFNITHNKYRLIALFRYKIQTVYIRFIGTHKEYDKLSDIENI
jgi:mRNA interferase HigB